MTTLKFDPQQPVTIDDIHLNAYNGAFWDIGFKWQWDTDTYRELCRMPEEKARIRAYVERHQPHLMKAYDLEFLTDLIHQNKTRRYAALVAAETTGQPPDLACNAINGSN